MKKIINLLLMAVSMTLLTSCAIYAQDDLYDSRQPSMSIVIEYGTPHYAPNGLISYYFYDGWYCYPYLVDNVYRFHYYRRPIPPRDIYHHRPLPRPYRPIPNHGVRGHYHGSFNHSTHQYNNGHRPNPNINHGRFGEKR